ncbi:MAG: LytTR family transcriptional regulator [Cytophagaceae bacterium]|nr:LytTR family transcriptional regulator [Gemmatimonadaceae bacterium]
MTKGRVSLMPAPAMSVGVIALAVTAGITLQILANHRLTGRPTPVSLALTWAMSTTGAWIFAVLLSLFLAGLAVRIRLVVPRAAVLIMLAVLCVTIAVTARALVDTLLPSTVQQGLTGVDLWIRYFVRWSGPGMLVALAVVALPTLQSRLTVGAQPEATPSPSPEPTTDPLDVVVVRIGERSIPVALSQVHWIGAAGNYAELHGATGHHLARITMSDLERRLDPARFVRVHRSAIVALPSIRAVRPRPNGSTEVVMVDGTVVPLSRVGRKALEAKMGSRG